MGRDGGGGSGMMAYGASVLPRITGDGAAGTRPGSLDAELRSTLYPLELLHAARPHKYNDTGIVPDTSVPACWGTSVKISFSDPALDNGDRV